MAFRKRGNVPVHFISFKPCFALEMPLFRERLKKPGSTPCIHEASSPLLQTAALGFAPAGRGLFAQCFQHAQQPNLGRLEKAKVYGVVS